MEAATTPAGLANTELALDRLARAVLLLEDEGIGLDTALGNLQIGYRSDRQYPVHGGNRHEGIANLQMSTTVGNNPTETPISRAATSLLGTAIACRNQATTSFTALASL